MLGRFAPALVSATDQTVLPNSLLVNQFRVCGSSTTRLWPHWSRLWLFSHTLAFCAQYAI